jgi:putative ABC transport system permease protein
MIQDLRYALRQLAKAPGFTAVAVLTLALGIGANTAVFSVFKTLVLEPLSYPAADRLVHIWSTEPEGSWQNPLAEPDYADLREQTTSFAETAMYGVQFFNLGGERPESVQGASCTAGLFRTLGVQPALGRWFNDADEQRGAPPTVIISQALWRRSFAADPELIGQSIRIDGQDITVVGVMSASFDFLCPWALGTSTDLWIPRSPSRNNNARGSLSQLVVARLKSGVTTGTANAELKTFGSRLAQAHPESNQRITFWLQPFPAQFNGPVAKRLIALWGAVGLVLLLACANVAGMLLARGSSRQAEIGVRVALGARRRDIGRLLLTESLLLALLGSGAGLLLAAWGIDAMQGFAPAELTRAHRFQLDGWALAFATATAVGTALVCGLPPTLVAARTQIIDTLKESGLSRSTSRTRHRFLRGLVVAQIAAALLLVNVAVLLFSSYRKVAAASSDLATEKVLTAHLSLAGPKYRQAGTRAALGEQLLTRLQTLPGVQAVGVTTKLPFEGGNNTNILLAGESFDPGSPKPDVEVSTVTPGYFAAMGLRLFKGRLLTVADASSSGEQGILVNRAFVDHYWPGQDPLGRRVRPNTLRPDWTAAIIGVVENARQQGATQAAIPEMYFAFANDWRRNTTLIVRTAGDARALTAAIRQELARLDPDLPLGQVRTMQDVFSGTVQTWRFMIGLTDLFMGLALLLAAVGLFGTLSFYVGQRTREIGIRIALGADRRTILRLVFQQAGRWVGSGAIVGLAGSVALALLLRSEFYEIDPLEPRYLFSALAVVIAAALLAAWLPARRATRINPVEALRSE